MTETRDEQLDRIARDPTFWDRSDWWVLRGLGVLFVLALIGVTAIGIRIWEAFV